MVSAQKDGETITYAMMVKRLFKPMDGVGARMMHAAIGIAGESGEIRCASSRKNLREEFGDSEFYVEAAWQELPEGARLGLYADTKIFAYPAFGDVVGELHRISSELLDQAKKVWVYGGSKGLRDQEIGALLFEYEITLQGAYNYLGFDRAEIQHENMIKLLLGGQDVAPRYASGSYSDAEALAKADQREPRKFMTDTRSPAPGPNEYTDAERAARGL